MKGVIHEKYGSSCLSRSYALVGDTVRETSKKTSRRVSFSARVRKLLMEAFLPQGYPESVSEDYLAYQLWDTVQAFCSYLMGTLSTQAILKGVGVGDSAASPVAATITWLLKDGLGMMGRIAFAWLKGSDLDCNAKTWRLVADILNDIALFLELLAPLIPFWFLTIVCVASAVKAVVGVAGGATRAAIVQHQAQRNNMADVSAKDGSQETLVNLAGLLCGLILTPAVDGRAEITWVLFFCFTTLHLYANFQAVSVVCMNTLNQSRFHLVMKHWICSGTVLTPAVINATEPILGALTRQFALEMGSSLAYALVSERQCITSYRQKEKYILRLCRSKNKIFVAFDTETSVEDHFEAASAAVILDYLLGSKDIPQSPFMSKYIEIYRKIQHQGVGTITFDEEMTELAKRVSRENIQTILMHLRLSGWVTSHHLLGILEWRYDWK